MPHVEAGVGVVLPARAEQAHVHFHLEPRHVELRDGAGSAGHAGVDPCLPVRLHVGERLLRLQVVRVERGADAVRPDRQGRIDDLVVHRIVEARDAILHARTEVAHGHAVLPELQPVDARVAEVAGKTALVAGEEVEVAARVDRVRVRALVDGGTVEDDRLAALGERDVEGVPGRAEVDAVAGPRGRGIETRLVVAHPELAVGHVDEIEALRGITRAGAQERALRMFQTVAEVHVALGVDRARRIQGEREFARRADVVARAHARVEPGVALRLEVFDEVVGPAGRRVAARHQPAGAREEEAAGDPVQQRGPAVLHAGDEVAHERLAVIELQRIAARLRLVDRRAVLVAGEEVEVQPRVDGRTVRAGDLVHAIDGQLLFAALQNRTDVVDDPRLRRGAGVVEVVVADRVLLEVVVHVEARVRPEARCDVRAVAGHLGPGHPGFKRQAAPADDVQIDEGDTVRLDVLDIGVGFGRVRPRDELGARGREEEPARDRVAEAGAAVLQHGREVALQLAVLPDLQTVDARPGQAGDPPGDVVAEDREVAAGVDERVRHRVLGLLDLVLHHLDAVDRHPDRRLVVAGLRELG